MLTVSELITAMRARESVGLDPLDRSRDEDHIGARSLERRMVKDLLDLSLCPDCGLLVATEKHRAMCPDSCNGCSRCLSVCWRDYHFDGCQNKKTR